MSIQTTGGGVVYTVMLHCEPLESMSEMSVVKTSLASPVLMLGYRFIKISDASFTIVRACFHAA